MSADAGGMCLDGILMHGVPAGELLDQFISDLDHQLGENQIQ